MASRMPKINPGAVIAAASGVAGLAGIGYLGFNSIYSGELGAEHLTVVRVSPCRPGPAAARSRREAARYTSSSVLAGAV